MNTMIESIKETMIGLICFVGMFACVYGFGTLCVAWFGSSVATTITVLVCGFAFALCWLELFKVVHRKLLAK